MPTLYSADTLTIGEADHASVDRLNSILDNAGLGRPLGPLSRPVGDRLVVQVNGVSPAAVRNALRTRTAEDVQLDPVYLAGTFRLAGNRVGEAFLPQDLAVPDTRDVPPWKTPPGNLRRPVIALFDTGVRNHPWLPVTPPDDPFLLRPDDPALDEPWVSPFSDLSGQDPRSGHATFVAGLLRGAAPGARVLDVRVMTDDGKVLQSTLVDALHWLERYRASGHPVDVLLLPFGRRPAEGERVEEVADPLRRLAGAGVAVVAAAGNDHSDAEVHPAALPGVLAVGAGIGAYHADFSNFGGWVTRYREGVDIVGILPPDRWVRWTGTSFSAATMAGDLARPQVKAPGTR